MIAPLAPAGRAHFAPRNGHQLRHPLGRLFEGKRQCQFQIGATSATPSAAATRSSEETRTAEELLEDGAANPKVLKDARKVGSAEDVFG